MRRHAPTYRLIGLLALLLAAGCGRGGEEVVEIDFWGMGREGEVVEELLPAFEAEHPGIRVRVQQLPWTAAHEKLLTAYAGDALPDLWQLGNTWVPEFVALEALEPLGPRVARSAVIDSSDYFAGIWATNVLGGMSYGVPWYVDTRLLFYRKDLLAQAGYEAPPETWAAWKDAMERIKAIVGEDRYAVFLPTNEFEPLLVLALQQKEELLRDDARYGNFSSEGGRRAFQFYLDLFREGLAPAADNVAIANVYQEFAAGYFAFYITGPWNIGEFKRRLPEDVQDDWMTAPMPGPDSLGFSTAGGSSLVLSRDSEHKDEAWAFVEYLSRPDVQVRFHALTGNLPPREATWQDSVFASDPYAQAFRRQLYRVEPTPKIPEWERIAQLLRIYAEAVVNDRMTVDEAVTGLDREVDRILEKRRWLLDRKTP